MEKVEYEKPLPSKQGFPYSIAGTLLLVYSSG
jgi:hypothetical protein